MAFHKKGNNSWELRYESINEVLESMIKAGITHVKLMSFRDDNVCKLCYEADGTILEIKYAYENNILPHPDCENDICRCWYLPTNK